MINKILVSDAYYSLCPDAEWIVRNNQVEWLSPDVPQPTYSEIQAEVTRLQAEYDASQYQRDRKVKYDALNQLELISDDAINGTTTHKDAILAIKAEIPKPGET